jgi:hypothetical protein
LVSSAHLTAGAAIAAAAERQTATTPVPALAEALAVHTLAATAAAEAVAACSSRPGFQALVPVNLYEHTARVLSSSLQAPVACFQTPFGML